MSDSLARPAPSPALPARDLVEIRVAEQLTGAGCPLCGVRADGERRAIDALIGEAVTDVAVRRRLDLARGYCGAHAAMLPIRERAKRGGTLGSAILLGSVLRARLDALDEIGATTGRRLRGRVEAARVPPACPVCRDVEAAVGSFLTIAIGRLADPAWAAAFGQAGLCLDDVLFLWDVATRAGGRTLEAWRPIGATQSARLRAILATVDGYIDHSGHDRQAELTDVERAAADEAARILAGDGVPTRPAR